MPRTPESRPTPCGLPANWRNRLERRQGKRPRLLSTARFSDMERAGPPRPWRSPGSSILTNLALVDALLDGGGEGFQVADALLDVVVEQVVAERAGVVDERLAQVRQDFEPVGQRAGDDLLRGHDAQQLIIAFGAAQPQRGDQDAADVQASLYRQLQVPLRQPVDAIIAGKFLALRLL